MMKIVKPTLAAVFAPALLLSTAAAQATPPGTGWVTGYDLIIPQTGQPEPLLNEPFVDDVYGRTIRRISEPDDLSGPWVRHEYSRRQAFNADNSAMILMASNGAWRLYRIGSNDTVTFDHKLPSMSEPNWHPTDPGRFRHLPRNGGLQILEYDIASRTSVVVADFANRLPWGDVAHAWTLEEGEPSADGNTWCLLAEDSSYTTVGMFSYDLATDTILGTAGLSADPNHISTSPSGQYCVPSGSGIGGTWAYSTDFSSSRLLHGKSEHSDLAIDASGREVLVYADYSSGWISMVGLADGLNTPLVDLYEISGSAYAAHISGNNYDAPGYAVISTYAASLDYGATDASYGDIWGHDRLAIIELAASPTLYNVAYAHNVYTTYWTEPHASVSRDLTRIVFASNWETGSESDVAAYMVNLTDSGTTDGSGDTGDSESTEPEPDPTASISLSATPGKHRGAKWMQLEWSGATGAQVTISRTRNGAESAAWTVDNTGGYRDAIEKGGSYEYQVCETDGSVCSELIVASF